MCLGYGILGRMWGWLLLGTAVAQVSPEGAEGFATCFADDACGPRLTGSISETMAHVGMGLLAEPLATSALGGKGMGLVIEGQLATMPLEPRNALDRALRIPPALPRAVVGYQLGSYTYDDPYPQLAAGAHVLPPVRVGENQVWSVGGELSAAVPLGTHLVWFGGEVGVGRARIDAPFLGSAAQLATWVPLDESGTPATCGGTVSSSPCIDTFLQDQFALRAGFSVEPHSSLFGLVRGALVGWWQRLDVALDGSTWRMSGWQPQVHLGGGIRAGDRYQLGGCWVLGATPSQLSTDDRRWLSRVLVSTSFRFGRVRYWDRGDDGEGPTFHLGVGSRAPTG